MKNDAVINIALPLNLKNKIQQNAKSKNISLNSLIRLIVTEYLEGNSQHEI